jgi:hypothetical protein
MSVIRQLGRRRARAAAAGVVTAVAVAVAVAVIAHTRHCGPRAGGALGVHDLGPPHRRGLPRVRDGRRQHLLLDAATGNAQFHERLGRAVTPPASVGDRLLLAVEGDSERPYEIRAYSVGGEMLWTTAVDYHTINPYGAPAVGRWRRGIRHVAGRAGRSGRRHGHRTVARNGAARPPRHVPPRLRLVTRGDDSDTVEVGDVGERLDVPDTVDHPEVEKRSAGPISSTRPTTTQAGPATFWHGCGTKRPLVRHALPGRPAPFTAGRERLVAGDQPVE